MADVKVTVVVTSQCAGDSGRWASGMLEITHSICILYLGWLRWPQVLITDQRHWQV